MARLYGRAPYGQRCVAAVPHGHWKTMTFIAGLRTDGLTAPYVIEGAMNGPAFLTYIEQVLAPALDKGDVVFMDNGQIIERSPPAQIFAQPKEARTRAFLERLLEREGRRDG